MKLYRNCPDCHAERRPWKEGDPIIMRFGSCPVCKGEKYVPVAMSREAMAKAIHAFDESIGEVPADWPDTWAELSSGVRSVYLLRADAVSRLLDLDPSAEG